MSKHTVVALRCVRSEIETKLPDGTFERTLSSIVVFVADDGNLYLGVEMKSGEIARHSRTRISPAEAIKAALILINKMDLNVAEDGNISQFENLISAIRGELDESLYSSFANDLRVSTKTFCLTLGRLPAADKLPRVLRWLSPDDGETLRMAVEHSYSSGTLAGGEVSYFMKVGMLKPLSPCEKVASY